MASTFNSTHMFLFLFVFLVSGEIRSCESGSFKFNIHHRFSDEVKGVLNSEGLPEKHSPGYYATMVHRDRLVHGRQLASTNELSFIYGNDTYLISSLGFLYYANVSVGTPSVSFIVALDTGSDLFWLPCFCDTCPTFLNTSSGGKIKLNHYAPNASTTSNAVPCSSPLCELGNQCSKPTNNCLYQINYVSANTSSTGLLVEDVLHLATDDLKADPVNAKITLGCGVAQTGIFAENAAPNGLMGLGMEDISVPSFLASEGLTSNSFSMCFGYDGIGRIDFGDTGTLGQKETPINPMLQSQSYNVSFTQISIGGKPSSSGFTAIFDSGTSFTYLNDPVYSLITGQVNAAMKLKRYTFNGAFPFEFCYQIPPKATRYEYPAIKFTMKGGDEYIPLDPFVQIPLDDNTLVICLGIVQSTDSYDLIGQNFMTGYRMVFNRDKMVLGWNESNCYDNGAGSGSPSDTPPSDSPPSDSPPSDSPPSTTATPPSPDTPAGPGGNGTTGPRPRAGIGGTGDATRLNSFTSVFAIIILAILVV